MGVQTFPQPFQDDTLLPYFGWAGASFPFIPSNAADVTISSNTVWNDAKGYRQVKKLTINSGITLTIERTPFFIFCDELVSGSSTSVIDASGKPGKTNPAQAFPETFANGGTSDVVDTNNRGQGGGGGGMLFIICRKSSFAGTIKANGGNGYLGTVSSVSQGGQGALSSGAKSAGSTVQAEKWGGTSTNSSTSMPLAYLHSLAHLLSDGGASNGGTGGGSGSKSDAANIPGGGSGIGGGGGGSGQGVPAGESSKATLTPRSLILLAENGCRGGGGGALYTTRGAGGGGGSVVIWSKNFVSNPTLQANGGTGSDANAGAGGAGVTFQIAL